ncbi:hypothetical protein E4U43_003834 [Claviceps pusilla]|uniref:Uncharacterized protein n=1 Tax=Claviceps pusilla TaxID=123648 RepID=A0A9P7N473_9HYPO|nr:hypothetical protein E4U43_003834 [Claviceps pusilla]
MTARAGPESWFVFSGWQMADGPGVVSSGTEPRSGWDWGQARRTGGPQGAVTRLVWSLVTGHWCLTCVVDRKQKVVVLILEMATRTTRTTRTSGRGGGPMLGYDWALDPGVQKGLSTGCAPPRSPSLDVTEQVWLAGQRQPERRQLAAADSSRQQPAMGQRTNQSDMDSWPATSKLQSPTLECLAG